MAEDVGNPSGPAEGASDAQSMAALTGYLDKQDKPQADQRPEQPDRPKPEATEQPASQAEASELTVEDLPDEASPAVVQPSDADAFTLVHDGQERKLSRAEAIELAQKGFDYTQKTQLLAEQQRVVQERFQRVQAIEQVHPHLQQAQAQVQALDMQIGQYMQAIDRAGGLVALATNDPLEYSKVRAQLDQLQQVRGQAMGQYGQIANAVKQQTDALNAQSMQVEAQKLTDRIPEWKDPVKYKAGAQKLSAWLIAEGADPGEVANLNSAVAVSIARKAMLYDELVKAKNSKVKLLQTAPPVTRPGAVAGADAVSSDRTQQLQAKFKKSGDIRDGAALLTRYLK